MPAIDIDLLSDTVTRPSRAMREFMCDAEVGDEQNFEDPTVNALQEMVADLLGKQAALFLPSGTMCNEIALRVHCRPGDSNRTRLSLNYSLERVLRDRLGGLAVQADEIGRDWALGAHNGGRVRILGVARVVDEQEE